VIGKVPPERAGASSALMETASEFGGALGIAILGSIGTAVYRARLGDRLPGAAGDTLSGAVATAGHLPQRMAGQVLAAAREAFVGGLHAVAWTSAAIMRRFLSVGSFRVAPWFATGTSNADPAILCRRRTAR
jgi:DHA2 family multidrug resistance protein-like MFS transporter